MATSEPDPLAALRLKAKTESLTTEETALFVRLKRKSFLAIPQGRKDKSEAKKKAKAPVPTTEQIDFF